MKHKVRIVQLTVLGVLASLVLMAVPAQSAVMGSYIVVFEDTVNAHATVPDVAKAYGLQVGFTYEHALKGMSAQVPEGRLNALRHDPRVKYVEEVREHSIDAQQVPTGIQRIFATGNENIGIGGDGGAVDVDVAVIDTGIDREHPDLDVVDGITCLTSTCSGNGDDDHYHGTHVAGTIAAIDNDTHVVGVAPGARLYAVKVLNRRGSGTTDGIVAGIDWVTARAATIEVANMSLGGPGFSQAEYDAIQGAVNAGVAFAVAAGNEDDDANTSRPGASGTVLAASALADWAGLPGGLATSGCFTDVDDTLAYFSNWGPEVDITAPGGCILSTYPLTKTATGLGTISGTSMASPHVAGALALLASGSNPGNATDVYALYNQVKSTGNYNWTDDSGDGIQEPLLDVSTFDPVMVGETDPDPDENQAPVAGFSFTTSDLTVSFTDTSSDSDGTISSWSWNFGDGGTSTASSPAYTYTATGIYTVSLTVTDDDGATGTTSQDVTVTAASTGEITLFVTTRAAGPNKFADLTWSGATGANVDVWRDTTKIVTANDGSYSDKVSKSTTSATYMVCETGSTTACSDQVHVTW